MSVVDFPSVNETVVQSLPPVSSPTMSQLPQSMPVVPVGVVTNGNSGNDSGHNMQVSLSPTTILVAGTSTKEYSTHLKNLGGAWNKGIQAWSFDIKYKNQVEDFVGAVTAGKIKPEPHMGFNFNTKKPYVRKTENAIISGNSNKVTSDITDTVFTLPSIDGHTGDFQKLEYAFVFKPRAGMIAKIRCGTNTLVRQVIKVEINRVGKVDTAFVQNGTDGTSKLEVSNGHWQVRGLIPEHKVFFENTKQ